MDKYWREQKRRRETEKKKRNRSSSIKAEHSRDIIAIVIIALSLAKIRDFSAAGTDRACSNKRSRKNKYSHCKPKSMDRICAKV